MTILQHLASELGSVNRYTATAKHQAAMFHRNREASDWEIPDMYHPTEANAAIIACNAAVLLQYYIIVYEVQELRVDTFWLRLNTFGCQAAGSV